MSHFLSFLISSSPFQFLVIGLGSLCLPFAAQAEEIGHLHVKVEPQRIEFRLKFSLQTLQKFLVLDSDHNGFLSKQELSGQEMALRDYLARHILVTLNGRDTNLGFPKPMARLWPEDSSDNDVPMSEFDQRWVEFIYMKSAQPYIADVSIRFEVFKDASELDRIQAVIEQSGNISQASLNRSKSEHQWQTGFTADSIATHEPSPSDAAPVSAVDSTSSSYMIVFGLVALAVTWLLLRRVHRISRGSFYIGPRE